MSALRPLPSCIAIWKWMWVKWVELTFEYFWPKVADTMKHMTNGEVATHESAWSFPLVSAKGIRLAQCLRKKSGSWTMGMIGHEPDELSLATKAEPAFRSFRWHHGNTTVKPCDTIWAETLDSWNSIAPLCFAWADRCVGWEKAEGALTRHILKVRCKQDWGRCK